ncbi:MAG: hypothetical protein JKY11_02775 [Alphaproteobacteria bacterium]|nr:hypothetical protein [Alphaproteobacteria bacterium]
MDKIVKTDMDEKTAKKEANIPQSIAPEILEKTLKLIRTVGTGNGIKNDQVEITNFNGKTIHSRAQTIITLKPLITKKIIAGRESEGTVVDNEQKLNSAIQKTSELISEDESVAKKITDLILKREDQGFAMKGHKQKFHSLKKGFALHTPCSTCHANGKVTCTNCHATGKVTCTNCHGRRETQCINCSGNGFVQTQQGRINCTKCQGRRQIPCTMCASRGQIACRTCGSQGKMQCHACAATGWMTEIALVEQEGVFMFHVNRAPPQAPEIIEEDLALSIERQGAQMLLRYDLEAVISKTTQEEKALLKPSQIAIGYDVKMPYGELSFTIKGRPYTSKLIGYQGRLVDAPAFLEKTVGKQLTALKRAATAPSTQTYSILEKACSARLIRDIIKMSAEQPAKVAMKMLLKRYPYGIHEKTLKSMIGYTRKSFLDLTRAGRYKGLAAGFALAAIITALYYFFLRSMVIPYIPKTMIAVTIIDIIAFGLGLVSNLSLVQYIGRSDLSKNLRQLLKKQIKIRMTQVRTGKAWIWSIVGNIALFFGISWIALIMGYIGIYPMWLNL